MTAEASASRWRGPRESGVRAIRAGATTAAMFDAAILEHLQAPLPPEPPPVVIEEVWKSEPAKQVERMAQRELVNYKAYVADWMAKIDRIQTGFESAVFPVPVPEQVLSEMDDLLADFEATADRKAVLAARAVKRRQRETRAVFKIDPSAGAVFRSVDQEFARLDRAIVERLLDYALFIRAVRAAAQPDAGTGPVFDNVHDLERHLEGLIAA